MKTYLSAGVLFLAFSAAAAQAQTSSSDLSFSLLGGWSWHPGLMLGGAKTGVNDAYNAGARLSAPLNGLGLENLSLDADYFYNRTDYAGAAGTHLDSHSVMGDLIYRVPTSTPWSFYGGGGVGLVHDNLNGALHGSSDVLGWQVLGGADYAFTPTTSLFAEYRYQNAHDANIGAIKGVGNISNNLSMGVRFTF
jgi:opacity protein-like surface antigen